jgi:hypothetical protein
VVMVHVFTDKTLFIQICMWTTCNGISMVAVWSLLIAIVRNPPARRSPYNIYLMSCLFPDAYTNTAGFIANVTNLLTEGVVFEKLCVMFGWNDPYWWTSHSWMSFLVVYEITKMFKANKAARRYKPPTPKCVILQSMMVQTFSVGMACLTLIPVNFIPNANLEGGCEAYPDPGNAKQMIYFWAFFIPITLVLPALLVSSLCITIWRSGLMPERGRKSRALLFYFARLLGVAYIVLMLVVMSNLFGNWGSAVAFAFFKLVGLAQVCLALLKEDIKNAWIQCWCCRPQADAENRKRSSAFSGLIRKSLSGAERRLSTSDNLSRVDEGNLSRADEGVAGYDGKVEMFADGKVEANNELTKVRTGSNGEDPDVETTRR